MKFLVWGAGAIGGTLGAHLVRAGHDITLVDRAAEHVEAINRNGLRITGPIAEFTARAKAYSPEALPGTFDHIVLAVKAQDTESAARALAPHLTAGGYVVSAQNGLNELVIKQVVGEARTIGCFVNFGADYLEPGVIMYGGRGAVVVGEIDGRMTPRLAELHRAFLDFEDRAIMTANIWGFLWGKLAYGAQLFATALTDEGIADALARPEYRGVYSAIAHEVMAVAQARGIKPEAFNGFDPHAFMPGVSREVSERSLDEMVAFNRKSAKTHSGIWRDLAVRKRKTEADPQLGPIVTLGAEVGVAAPLTAKVIAMIHEIEDGKRKMSTANLDILKSLVTSD
ncbi:MAG: 2-dehydropantoate 2-reductase [Chloroflexi bacterium]|nr:2-dehydropantoate 2-reductase [Chloroflexota bacterium]